MAFSCFLNSTVFETLPGTEIHAEDNRQISPCPQEAHSLREIQVNKIYCACLVSTFCWRPERSWGGMQKAGGFLQGGRKDEQERVGPGGRLGSPLHCLDCMFLEGFGIHGFCFPNINLHRVIYS